MYSIKNWEKGVTHWQFRMIKNTAKVPCNVSQVIKLYVTWAPSQKRKGYYVTVLFMSF